MGQLIQSSKLFLFSKTKEIKGIKLCFQDWLANIAGKAVGKTYSSVLIHQQNVAKIALLF